MSIQSEITRISGNVSDAFTAIAAKGGTVPTGANSDDLAAAIASISGGGLPNEIIDISNTGVVMSNENTPVGGYNYRMYAYITNPGTFYAQKSEKTQPSAGNPLIRCTYQYHLPSTIAYPTNAYIVIVMNDNNANECIVGYFTGNPLEQLENATQYNGLGAHLSSSGTSTGLVSAGQPVIHWYDGGKGSLNYLVIETYQGTANVTSAMPSVYIIPTDQTPFFESISKTITTNTTSSYHRSYNYYDGISDVNITTNISPTLTTVFGTTNGASCAANGTKTIELGSTVGNTHPFSIVLLGGTVGSSSYATRTITLRYDGSGLNGTGHFTVSYDKDDSYTSKVTLSGCTISSAGQLKVKFSTTWYPNGTSNSSTTLKYPCTYIS